MRKERRDFLKAAGRVVRRAGISAVVAVPFGYAFGRYSQEKSSDARIDPLEHDLDETDNKVVAALKSKYGFSTIAQAEEVYKRMLFETTLYYAGGGAIGSLTRSGIEKTDNSKRSFVRAGIRMFGSYYTGKLAEYPVEAGVSAIQSSPLTNPKTLEDDYGLSKASAQVFCYRYSDILNAAMAKGAGAITLLQEWLLSDPVEKAPEALEQA